MRATPSGEVTTVSPVQTSTREALSRHQAGGRKTWRGTSVTAAATPGAIPALRRRRRSAERASGRSTYPFDGVVERARRPVGPRMWSRAGTVICGPETLGCILVCRRVVVQNHDGQRAEDTS